jgi:hypothetical protein
LLARPFLDIIFRKPWSEWPGLELMIRSESGDKYMGEALSVRIGICSK